MSVQRYGCEGETSRNCLHHAGRQHLNRTSLQTFCRPLRRSHPAGGFPLRNVSSMCDFLEGIACHKLFSAHFLRKSLAKNFLISSGNRLPRTSSFPQEIARHKTFSAHFLRKSAVTKLFRLISSGNRPPQTVSAHFLRKSAATNFFGPFPQEIGRHKTVSAYFLRKSAAHLLTHFLRKSAATYSLISSGNRPPLTHSFPQEIACQELLHFLEEIVG